MASSDQVFYWANKTYFDGLPLLGITGDISSEGKRIFVIRVKFWSRLITGNYEEGMDQAEFEWKGPLQSQEWEYLVLNESAYGMRLCIFGLPKPYICYIN